MNCLARLVLACLACVTFAAAAHGPAAQSAAQPRAATASGNARALTLQLMDAATAYNTGAPAAKGLLIANLLNIAKARHDELVLTAQTDPAEFMRVVLPDALLARLPAQAMPFLEQSASVSGTVDVYHVDHVDPADDYYEHVLTAATGNAVYNLHFATRAPDLVSGTRLTVRGMRVDNHIVIASAADVLVSKAVSVLGGTLGVQKTLVILVNFSDASTAQPTTIATAQSVVFGDTSNYDMATSYQQASLSGTVVGVYTIAELSTSCNYTTIASQAKQAASNAGVSLSGYTRFMYIFPSNTCAWWGLGMVGGNPSQSWIHAKYGVSLQVTGHEMGHNFGLYHSHSMDCGSAVLAASGCTTSEYGDVFDLMGNSTPGHYNAYHKERLGWLNAGNSPPLITVPVQSATATYTIAPLENARDASPRALKIPRTSCAAGTSDYFYVEKRNTVGNGVVVHKVTDGVVDSSYLLDMTPATSSWSDAALPTGATFLDTQTGLSITPTSVTAAGAQVSVSFGTASCARAAPTMTFTPTSTVWTSAGAQVTYAVSVTNNDSCGCAATAFDVTAAGLPASWTATSAHTGNIAPGAKTTTSAVVSTAAGTGANLYTFQLKAANASAASMAASSNATIAISSAVTATVTTDQATYTMPKQGNGTVSAVITTTVSSNGGGVGGASVSVQVRDPGGKSTTMSGVTASNGVLTVSYTMRSKTAAKGQYTVTSTGTLGTLTGTGSTKFTVN